MVEPPSGNGTSKGRLTAPETAGLASGVKTARREVSRAMLAKVGATVGGVLVTSAVLAFTNAWSIALAHPMWAAAFLFALTSVIGLGGLIYARQKLAGRRAAWTFRPHYGVWWRVNPRLGIVEEMPYCSCCEPKRLLNAKDWYPDLVLVCPVSKNEFRLYEGAVHLPAVDQAVESLRSAYDPGQALFRHLHDIELRYRTRHRDATLEEVRDWLLEQPPLKYLSRAQRMELRTSCANAALVIERVARNMDEYGAVLTRYSVE